jgi:hypothetical protein
MPGEGVRPACGLRLPREGAFFRCWSRKEAYINARLSAPLTGLALQDLPLGAPDCFSLQ